MAGKSHHSSVCCLFLALTISTHSFSAAEQSNDISCEMVSNGASSYTSVARHKLWTINGSDFCSLTSHTKWMFNWGCTNPVKRHIINIVSFRYCAVIWCRTNWRNDPLKNGDDTLTHTKWRTEYAQRFFFYYFRMTVGLLCASFCSLFAAVSSSKVILKNGTGMCWNHLRNEIILNRDELVGSNFAVCWNSLSIFIITRWVCAIKMSTKQREEQRDNHKCLCVRDESWCVVFLKFVWICGKYSLRTEKRPEHNNMCWTTMTTMTVEASDEKNINSMV